MKVGSVKNQYGGINPHLHSLWQAQGGWNSFHTAHIADLNKTLKGQLLPMGYTAEIEASLQIRRVGETSTEIETDITIYDLYSTRAQQALPKLLAESEISEKQYGAIAIYERQAKGQPVAWIELLSPSNKGSSRDAETYREKRLKVLQSGIVYVEIDYLHESLPTFPLIHDYRGRKGSATNAHPYRLIVIDPRPEFDAGEAWVSEFDVDQPIPTVTIPLNSDDTLDFDFGIPYAKTFEEMLYGAELVDYSQLPVNFDHYSEPDRVRIVARMLAVVEAAQRGENLEENVPRPVKSISLQEGLARLASMSNAIP